MSMKNPLTLAGIEPATFRFVAQYFKKRDSQLKIIFSYCRVDKGGSGSDSVLL